MWGTLGLVVSSIVGGLATDVLPEVAELGAVAGAFGLGLGLLWPLVGPISEISRLAGAWAVGGAVVGSLS